MDLRANLPICVLFTEIFVDFFIVCLRCESMFVAFAPILFFNEHDKLEVNGCVFVEKFFCYFLLSLLTSPLDSSEEESRPRFILALSFGVRLSAFLESSEELAS